MAEPQELNERELKVLRSMSRAQAGLVLDDIAAGCGYRPASHGRLPVRNLLRALLIRYEDEYQHGPYGECGRHVGRNPPRDRWACERWFLTDEGRRVAANAETDPS